MIARLSIPGVWMWSAWQPDRAMAFNSYLFERTQAEDGDGAVVVDPLPLDEAALAWIASRGGVRTVVLTNRDHARAAQLFRERFGARVLAHAVEAPLFDIPIDATFADGAEVFPGARAVSLPFGKTPGEVAIHVPRARCAVVGDAVIGAPAGSLSLLPDEKLEDPARFVLSLRALWALHLDALLLGDGQPVFQAADDALATLLERRGGAEVNRINLDELEFRPLRRGDGAKFEAADGEVGLFIGARKLGYRVCEIPPGKAFCPLHSHQAEEEFFYVLKGNPSIRTLRGTIECRPGDFIAFPTGERGTHQLRNDAQDPCVVLMVGMNSEDEVCFYPDSQKVLVDVRGRRLMVRSAPQLDYLEGE
jgi:uncharacterized cupin superfamily protein